MAVSKDYLEYVQDQLSGWDEVYPKKMFGIIGLYFDGLMFGIVSNDAVFLKVDKSNKNKFLEADSAPLKLFKKNAEVPSFYELSVEVLENAELFVEWAKESFAIQKNK